MARVRKYKPGKYGKGTIPDERKPEAQIWRVGKWDGTPHHDDVAEALGIDRPMVTFHIDRDGAFFFHHSGEGHLKPKDPARLAAAVERQHPGLRWGRESVEQHERTAKTLDWHFDPDQPRDWHGRWDGGSETEPAWKWSEAAVVHRYGFRVSTGGDAVPGGYNGYFAAYDPKTGAKMGWLDYNSAGREAVIADLQVLPGFQRQQVASKLFDFARRYDPEMAWRHGMTTDQGSAWVKSLPPELQRNLIPPLGKQLARTLAMQARPLRDFEKGAHLHVLDWCHDTARYRFQAAGAAQVKAASKAVVKGAVAAPPSLPSLQAALHGELRKLYAVGHGTVRSELDHQATGEALPVGLSRAPAPPNLRTANAAKRRCGTCHMFDNGTCWGYGNYGVEPDEMCDSWAPETVKTLAIGDTPRDPGSLLTRAQLIASDVAHRIFQAVHRARLQGITDKRRLRALGEEAGHTGLRVAASSHAGGAIMAGRHAAASDHGKVIGARYTSVLDKNTCGPCADADTGQLLPLDQVPPAPNPACLGGDRCRCILVYQLSTETPRTRTPPPPRAPEQQFPDETKQPDRASGQAALRVAQVGVGAS